MQMNRLCIIGYFLTWRLAARVHCTYICEKYAEARIRVYDGKQNCARLDLAIAQEAYTGDWYPRLLVPLICTGIENELSEFSVIFYLHGVVKNKFNLNIPKRTNLL